jgi:hypothetical protein
VAPRSKDENVFVDLVRDPAVQFKQDDPVLVTLAACHTLTRIEGLYNFLLLIKELFSTAMIPLIRSIDW